MTKPLVNILYFPGTQCERETMAAYKLAGFETRLVYIDELLTGRLRIFDCDVCHIPGGFSEMDSIDVGRIAAAVSRDVLPQLNEKQIPTCGVCNGFQIMTEAGLFGDGIALTKNDCETFVSRPVRHRILSTHNIWLRGLAGEVYEFPAAHGSGKLINRVSQLSMVAKTVMLYENKSPNGGLIAGISDEAGLFLGLMDHWERPWNNPAGQAILANLKKNL